MVSISGMFYQGGPFMYVVLMFAMIGTIVVMIGAGLGMGRVRVPAVLWLGAPLLAITAGAVGELLGLRLAIEAIAYASPEVRSALAHAGTAAASTTTVFAMLLSGVLLGMGAWLAALPAAAVPGEGARTTVLTGLAGAALAALAGLGLVAWAFPMRGASMAIGAALVLLSPALLVGGARAGTGEDDQARSAEARVSVALCAVGAVACTSAYVYLSGDVACHEALAHASAETKMVLLAVGREQQRFAAAAGAAGTAAAAAASLIAIGPLLGAAFSGRTIGSVVAAGLGLLLFGAAEAGVAYHRGLVAEAWTESALLGLQQAVPDMPLPQDLDGEDAYGEGIRAYDHVVTWPSGAAPQPGLPLPAPEHGDDLFVAVAASASTPISALAGQPWSGVPVQLDVLLAPSWMPEEAKGDPLLEPSLLSTLPVLWVPASDLDDTVMAGLHRDPEVLVLYDKDGRSVLHQADHAPIVVVDLHAAAEEIRARLDASPEVRRLAVGPAAWTTQRLVGLSASVNDGRWGEDKIGLELLARHSPPALPASGRGSRNNGGATAGSGDVQIMGSLSKDEISRVLRRHMNQIRYCYQRELTKDPQLGGKIEIRFVIAADGSVSSAEAESSTMGSSAVEQCLVGRFLRFQFPPPEGGGIVVVRYPFVFSPQ